MLFALKIALPPVSDASWVRADWKFASVIDWFWGPPPNLAALSDTSAPAGALIPRASTVIRVMRCALARPATWCSLFAMLWTLRMRLLNSRSRSGQSAWSRSRMATPGWISMLPLSTTRSFRPGTAPRYSIASLSNWVRISLEADAFAA